MDNFYDDKIEKSLIKDYKKSLYGLTPEQKKVVGLMIERQIERTNCYHYEYRGDTQIKVDCSNKDEHCYCCCPTGISINMVRKVFGLNSYTRI